MDSQLSLRPATDDDLPQLAAIEAKAGVSGWTQENFAAEIAKPYSHTLLMTDDETDSVIAAYIVFWLMFDECHILNLVVDLPHRGTGLAQSMLRKAVSLAVQKNIRKVLLEVRKSNQAAIQLYQKVGFTITHVRKSFYSDGEDAYQMSLFVDQQVVEF